MTLLRTVLLAGLCAALLLPAAQAAETGNPGPPPLVLAARDGVEGTRAPALVLETIDGEQISLADLYGKKAVYLKFWATWCVPCRAQMPHFENVYQHAGDDLAVIALNAGFNETFEDIQDYREELGIHMPIVVDDGTLAGLFNLRITPQHIVIGKDGVIRHVGQGADAELDGALQLARSATPVESATVAALAADSGPRFMVGDLLPPEILETSTHERFALGDTGTSAGTVLVFMIPWCEDYLANTRPEAGTRCREVREQVEALKQQTEGIRWLGISSGIWTLAPDLNAYERKYATTLPLALDADGHLFHAFGVSAVPTLVVADASGKIIKRLEGHDSGLEQVLAELQGE